MRNVVEFFKREAEGDIRLILALAVVAGFANSLILALGVEAARDSSGGSAQLLALFLISIALYVVCARWTQHRITVLAETALDRIKIRIAAKIERAEVPELERIGLAQIFDRTSDTTSTITTAAGAVANLLMSAAILVGASAYLLWISPIAFALIVAVIGGGMLVFWRRNSKVVSMLHAQASKRVEFFDALSDLLYGSNEIKFSEARGRDLLHEVALRSARLRDISIDAKKIFDDNHVFANCLLFATLFLVTFVVPKYFSLPTEAIIALVTAVTYAWGPLGAIAAGVPAFVRLGVAVQLIQQLEERLDSVAEHQGAQAKDDPWTEGFERIELSGIEYAYESAHGNGFTIGPIDLEIEPGEIVFLVGGNGSGKSTLFKVLTGLFGASGGALKVDGVAVGPRNLTAYRHRFSTILTEPYLFRKLYGMLDADPKEVARLLGVMKLVGKTDFADQGFTSLDLSTGQRKRLAMIVTLLEDRPIYAFDEWAADQDPEFRRFFYEELLPSLAARGKIVIAVTHDDRYFHCAGKIVTMDEGRIRSVERRSPRADPSSSSLEATDSPS